MNFYCNYFMIKSHNKNFLFVKTICLCMSAVCLRFQSLAGFGFETRQNSTTPKFFWKCRLQKLGYSLHSHFRMLEMTRTTIWFFFTYKIFKRGVRVCVGKKVLKYAEDWTKLYKFWSLESLQWEKKDSDYHLHNS